MPESLIRVNGVELCAEGFGNPHDPLLLLIHGTGTSMLSWDEELCGRLADGGRFVVRYDCRDAGRSMTSPLGAPAYDMRDLVADAIGMLDAFGAPRGHLVGMSGGGSAAQLAALDYPPRVASLTLVGTTTGIPGVESSDLPPPTVRFPDTPEPDWSDPAAVVEYLVAAERPYAAHFDAAAARALAERVVDRTNDLQASTANPFDVDPGAPWRQRLGEIAAPTLVIQGRQDPMFPPEHGRALATEIPDAELLLVEGMGHEHPPPRTWDVVVPAVLRHTAGSAATDEQPNPDHRE
jgi:pimeloyl-ACP methyl ester carboxylesterase